MPFTNDPINNPIDRIRLCVGDATVGNEILSDNVYQWLLDTYPTELRVCVEALRLILADFAKMSVRERVGQEEIYGQEAFENYKDMLKLLEDKMADSLGASGVYAGGISLLDFCTNRANLDNVRAPVQKGTNTTFTGDICHNEPENPTDSYPYPSVDDIYVD